MKPTHSVENGAFKPERTKDPRHLTSDGVSITVMPQGRTSLFARTYIRYPMGAPRPELQRREVFYAACMNGVNVYVTEKDGRAHIVIRRDQALP